MPDIPRLNGVIKALEQGKVAFTTFSPTEVDSATTISAAPYDGVIFEMEHGPFDTLALRDSLQFLLSRRQIVAGGTLAPAVTPMVRIPPNGNEMNQWIAKQVLDAGVYGIVFPHISTVEEAWNAVRACRYPSLPETENHNPPGIRGDAPTRAARYWGLTTQEYYERADVWPLNPNGEILAVLQCEDVTAIDNLPSILKEVPGIGVILIGEGDLSQELGFPRQYDHPVVADAINSIVRICKEHNVPVGHPHPDANNIDRLIGEGYQFLMPAAGRSYSVLERGRSLADRD